METDVSILLRRMADRIERNDPAEFAGLIVLVAPPDGNSGDMQTVELLLIDPRQDLANYWSTVKSKTEIAMDEFRSNQAPMPGYR